MTVDSRQLSVHHGPVPWLGNLTLNSRDLEQFYVVQREHNNRNGSYYRYNLNAVTRDHREVVVLKGLETVDQGLFLEQSLEELLNIRDPAVAGEVAQGQQF